MEGTHRPRAYYAAGLFNEGERTFNLRAKGVLDDLGYETWFPQEDAGFLEQYMEEGMTLQEARNAIFELNLNAVEQADVVIFNLDGRVPDEGACIEAGIAYGRGKRVIGLQTDFRAVEPGGNNLMIDGILGFEVAGNLDELRDKLALTAVEIDLTRDEIAVDLRGRDPYVVVSGPLGVGKSTLIDVMTTKGTWHALEEPVDENPYLADVYANLVDLGFRMQTYYLAKRAEQHLATRSMRGPVVQERCIVEDGLVFFPAYRDAGAYDENDLATLTALYTALQEDLPHPDLIVVPWAPFETTVERLIQRDRTSEREIDRTFLRSVYDRYERWIVDYADIPMVVLDALELDFVNRPEDQAEAMRQIDRVLRGVRQTV